jgi:hypothetical protein
LFKSKLFVDCSGRKRSLQPDHMGVLAGIPITHQPTVLSTSRRFLQDHI